MSATSQWEQHTISSVRLIDTQQRLIYKIRRSLMEGLSEEECPTLREELQLQLHRTSIGRGSGEPSPSINAQGLASPTAQASDDVKIGDIQTKNALKRAAPDHDGAHNSKVHISRDYYMAHSGTGSMSGTSTLVSSPGSGNPSPAAASTSAQQQQQDNVYMYQQNPVFYGGPGSTDTSSLPPYLLQPAASAAPIPYHPHPPLKRWPNDYTVSELSQGFHAMDLLISQSPTGASMTQRTAFERVFGSRYVKSTVCRHRAVWRKAPHGLREQFEEMGTDDRACWGEFVRRVEGRSPAKAGGSIGSDQGSVLGDYHDQRTPSDGDDVHVQEPVMNGIHAQGGNGLDHEQQMHAQQRHVEQYVRSLSLSDTFTQCWFFCAGMRTTTATATAWCITRSTAAD